ncbi:Vacuolar protein sorting-associated protein 11 [Mycoemilia scoparia]|uniref:E3 ubiquitin-protein ligase PEP5 n=1 Tax=Mycoemilia scoparia TaxID=417184 RepID=A0A9W8DJ09_9FUNG|nr:Vacuolar protein sorting-associated protein 11 [Mycoemilia scoparia]
MANFQLRQFDFCKHTQIEDIPQALKKPGQLVFSNNTGLFFLSDPETSYIHAVDETLDVKSFLITKNPDKEYVSHLVHLPEIESILIVKMDKDEEIDTRNASLPIIEMWPLNRLMSNTITSASEVKPINIPYQLAKPQPNQQLQSYSDRDGLGQNIRVTDITSLPRATQIAVGFNNGQVILIRGNVAKRKSTKQKVIYNQRDPITNLHFSYNNFYQTVLYITTTGSTLVCDTTQQAQNLQPVRGSPAADSPILLDYNGCNIGCSFVTEDGRLVVGCDDAIYFFSTEGRLGCFAFNGTKLMVKPYRRYILLATAEPSPMAPLTNTINSQSFLSDASNSLESSDTARAFTILDKENRLVAYTGLIEGGILGIITEWDTVFVLGNQENLIHFEEKELTDKLDILYRQNLYTTSLKVAKNENYDPPSLAEIHKRYGDYLYEKSDFDAAMNQYILTIGYIEPSYVIRKFLDVQKLDKLTRYVHELHVKNVASSDHTTLLVNCYTKLKDEGELDKFLTSQADYQFDVGAAIQVCRQAGYSKQALMLAERCGMQDVYLQILMDDDNDNYDAALTHLKSLHADDQIAMLKNELGTKFLKKKPYETTDLLINLATSTHGMSQISSLDFCPLFANHSRWLVYYLENVSRIKWGEYMTTPTSSDNDNNDTSLNEDHEHVNNDDDGGDKQEMKTVWNTLLELYLTGIDVPTETVVVNGNAQKDHESQANDNSTQNSNDQSMSTSASSSRYKALALLKNPKVLYDWDQAYVLCALDGFEEGLTLLYNKKNDPQALLQIQMDADNISGIMEILDLHGSSHPKLYQDTLRYLVHNPGLITIEHEDILPKCLDEINKGNLMHPLEVLQLLTQSSTGNDNSDSSNDDDREDTMVVTVGMVRKYLLEQVESVQKKIDDNQKVIDSYVEQNEKLREEMEGLQNNPVVFQDMRCSQCRAPLDLPSIHFLCRHSYHQRCLGGEISIDNEDDNNDSTSNTAGDHVIPCPLCWTETQTLQHQRKHQQIQASHHETFFNELKQRSVNSNDNESGFDYVAECFSRNSFAFTKGNTTTVAAGASSSLGH